MSLCGIIFFPIYIRPPSALRLVEVLPDNCKVVTCCAKEKTVVKQVFRRFAEGISYLPVYTVSHPLPRIRFQNYHIYYSSIAPSNGSCVRSCTTHRHDDGGIFGKKKKTLCRDEKSIGRPGLPHPSHSETYVRLCTGRYVQCALFYVCTTRGERTFHTCYGRIYTAEIRAI